MSTVIVLEIRFVFGLNTTKLLHLACKGGVYDNINDKD